MKPLLLALLITPVFAQGITIQGRNAFEFAKQYYPDTKHIVFLDDPTAAGFCAHTLGGMIQPDLSRVAVMCPYKKAGPCFLASEFVCADEVL